MRLLIAGMDEAGFGPLLGPLTLGFSVFEVEDADAADPKSAALPWKRLSSAVAREPKAGERRLVVADSKRVFARTPLGARRLEHTALAFSAQVTGSLAALAPARFVPGTFGCSEDWLDRHPWYGGVEASLPRHGEAGGVELAAEKLRRALDKNGVRVVDTGVHACCEGDYNALIGEHGNKSLALWHASVAVLRRLWDLCAGRTALAVCDRQGGRAHYGALIARALPDASVRVVYERDGDSVYELAGRSDGRRVTLRFLERGEEASFATALASCLAKYARELAMDALNAYFGAHQPDLTPTAGYSTDGRRWIEDAAPALARAGVRREALVRVR